jgi:hypothetical protein
MARVLPWKALRWVPTLKRASKLICGKREERAISASASACRTRARVAFSDRFTASARRMMASSAGSPSWSHHGAVSSLAS